MNRIISKKFFSLCVFVIIGTTITLSQKPQYPQNYFQLPLNIPVSLSGSFSELRSNHFHSGIDFRTNGKIGYPVFSVAKGYVSRIKVSAWGGGKILYINHPNGYKSVYMHLDCFEGEIARYVEAYQYNHTTFEFDIDLDSNVLKVEKGKLVARSGNTGGSSGPHLHFEIRETKNDRTINPLLFGYNIKDTIEPEIEGIRIYPGKSSFIDNKKQQVITINTSKPKKNIKKKGGTQKTLAKHSLNDTITVWGDIYFGIQTTDALNNSLGRRGVHKIELLIDNKLEYEYCMSDFLFEDTRFINAITDYEYYLKNNVFYILTKIPSCLPVEMTKNVKGKGVYTFTDKQVHKIQYKVSDFSGNTATKILYLKSEQPSFSGKVAEEEIPDFLCSKKNTFKKPDFEVELEKNTLYNPICFKYEVIKTNTNLYSDKYQILNEYIPLNKPFKLSLLPKSLPNNLKYKALIVRTNNKGKRFSEGGKWDGKMLVSQPKNFGIFEISVDTTAPKIMSVNFKENTLLKKQPNSLKVRISDNLSGIESYNCYLNGKWILAEYDGKSASLNINISNKILPNPSTLQVVVRDACSNKAVKEYMIKWR